MSAGWQRSGRELRLTVEVPVGSQAEVHVPAAGRSAVTAPEGAHYDRTESGHVVHRVPHGTWVFTARDVTG